FSRDWSSDVCSTDLDQLVARAVAAEGQHGWQRAALAQERQAGEQRARLAAEQGGARAALGPVVPPALERVEPVEAREGAAAVLGERKSGVQGQEGER